jgi:hypothetical protein
MDFIFPMKWQTEGYVTQELTPYDRAYANPQLRNDIFILKNSKIRFGTLVLFLREFCQI